MRLQPLRTRLGGGEADAPAPHCTGAAACLKRRACATFPECPIS